jgi:hypothetical protein
MLERRFFAQSRPNLLQWRFADGDSWNIAIDSGGLALKKRALSLPRDEGFERGDLTVCFFTEPEPQSNRQLTVDMVRLILELFDVQISIPPDPGIMSDLHLRSIRSGRGERVILRCKFTTWRRRARKAL